jgi:hypothetical protein
MATLHPTDYEQYLLELVNRARANPLGEVARNSDVSDLNEGLAPGTLNASAKQPLAFNLDLIEASRNHSQWMLDNDVFSHTGAGGSSAGKRMKDAGYDFTGAYTWGENLSWRGTTGTLDLAESVAIQHDGLFDSPGHRTNLMNGDLKEAGLGIITGDFQGYNASMVTQNFAKSGSETFLTGVIYDDGVVDDNFYTIGEAVDGVTIEAVRQSDGKTFATTNFDSGGYSLGLEPGTYTVTFSGAELEGNVTDTVTIENTNIKLDLALDTLIADLVTEAPEPMADRATSDLAVVPEPVPAPSMGSTMAPLEPEPAIALPSWWSQFEQQFDTWFVDNGASPWASWM